MKKLDFFTQEEDSAVEVDQIPDRQIRDSHTRGTLILQTQSSGMDSPFIITRDKNLSLLLGEKLETGDIPGVESSHRFEVLLISRSDIVGVINGGGVWVVKAAHVCHKLLELLRFGVDCEFHQTR